MYRPSKRFVCILCICISVYEIFALSWNNQKVVHRLKTLDKENTELVVKLGDGKSDYFKNDVLKPFLRSRVCGSVGNLQVQQHIRQMMLGLGWTIEEDSFVDDTPFGRKNFTNIIATQNPRASRRLVLACHFDSKFFEKFEFIGATDSAVPCAMIIDLAYHLNKYLDYPQDDARDISLELLFFDGEEAFVTWSNRDSLYGARHLARRMSKELLEVDREIVVSRLDTIDVLVLLDLIGTSDTMFTNYFTQTSRLYNHLHGIGSSPVQEITENSAIKLVHMPSPPVLFNKLPKVLALVSKVLWQSIFLFLSLCLQWKPSHILLQNPPALPTMAVCYIVSRLRNVHLMIDWHNYGYTILSLGLGTKHPLVAIYQKYERFCGRLVDSNICVTEAMKKDLAENWNIRAQTMHDRPPLRFKSLTLSEKHELCKKLDFFRVAESDAGKEMTKFTCKNAQGVVEYRHDRPALLISSTSWTEDEDFSVLLNALQEYENAVTTGRKLPKLICVITGKGPQKEFYLNKIKQMKWSNVEIITPWLEAEDYPRLLGSADLGICLHKSSSGLDLPMKVVDMFGCGLPVCAINFKCLDELVKNNENGLIFDTAEQLSLQIQDLLKGFPDDCSQLEKFRNNLKTFQKLRWDECWDRNVLPLFT